MSEPGNLYATFLFSIAEGPQAASQVSFVAALAVLAGVLEVGQIWVPGRTAQVIDFAASSVGALAGVLVGRAAIGSLVSWVMRPSR